MHSENQTILSDDMRLALKVLDRCKRTKNANAPAPVNLIARIAGVDDEAVSAAGRWGGFPVKDDKIGVTLASIRRAERWLEREKNRKTKKQRRAISDSIAAKYATRFG